MNQFNQNPFLPSRLMFVDTRWKDKNAIVVAWGDRFPITDVSAANEDKYWTPDLLDTYISQTTKTLTNKSWSNSQWTNDEGYTTNTWTVTASSTDTFTNKSWSNSQWTNDEWYTTNTWTVTASSTDTFTNKSWSNSQWTNDEDYIVSDPSWVTWADAVINVMSLTTAEYWAIGTPNASTLYVITDA